MNEIQDPPSALELFQSLEGLAPADFPTDSWYTIVATCLISIGRGDALGDLFKYLTQQRNISKKAVSTRLREVIIKSWTLVGMPRAISASYSLQSVDPDGDQFDQDHRLSSISNPETLRQTSSSWFQQAFGPKEDVIFARFKSHVDMEWTLRHVVYGIYLGDLTVLSVVENEFLVAACVVTTGGPKSPSISHLNALLRVGVTRAHVEVFERICDTISEWAGIDTRDRVKLHHILPDKE